MREWVISGFADLSDDFGLSEPSLAAEEIRCRSAAGEQLSERDVEDIAYKYHCRVSWMVPVSSDMSEKGSYPLLESLFRKPAPVVVEEDEGDA